MVSVDGDTVCFMRFTGNILLWVFHIVCVCVCVCVGLSVSVLPSVIQKTLRKARS